MKIAWGLGLRLSGIERTALAVFGICLSALVVICTMALGFSGLVASLLIGAMDTALVLTIIFLAHHTP